MITDNCITGIETFNGLKIIKNGSGSITFNGAVIFNFSDFNLKIEIKTDMLNSNPRFTLNGDVKNAILDLFNFDNPHGTATNTPIKFATNQQTKVSIFISLAVHKIGSTHVLHYTFLEGIYKERESNIILRLYKYIKSIYSKV